ncbi:MAG: hypothetical protein ACE5R6_17855 [Candidatus Heimdallarchaeota archaeon]
MTLMSVPVEIIDSIVKRLTNELRLYKSVVKKFEIKYGCSLEEFEQKLETEGIPVERHEMWEDSIEWRNAREEIKKIEEILKRLEL